MSIIKKSYSLTFDALKKHRALLLPFVIFIAFELAALLFFYLIPRMPLRPIFGPPIRTFWSERFLHYPLNFLLLIKLASLSRMFLSVLIGSLTTAMAVFIVFDIHNKKAINVKSSFMGSLKKYAALFAIVFIFTALFYFLAKLVTVGLLKYFIAGHTKLLFLKAGLWLGPILTVLNFIIAILIQGAFIYAIPILLIEKQRLIPAIAKSFVLFKNLFLPTVILIGLPMLLYVPILVLGSNAGFLIDKVFPEFVLLVLILGAIVSSLIIDPLVVVSTTFLYLTKRGK